MQLTHEILDRLNQLEQKYAVMGQDMLSYLDGLLYADYLTYWEYINLDTLLSLQKPETPFPDENIFILYHQITELYFKLAILALEQLGRQETPELAFFKRQVSRLNSYFAHLIHSFDIMEHGMDRGEFLKFRMSLLPASGFQSAQYRRIEIMSADLYRLVHHSKREALRPDLPVKELYESLYWKSGATELATGKKTLTLRQFEQKYAREFLQLSEEMRENNLWRLYLKLSPADQQDGELRQLLREHDFNANVLWPLSHMRSAIRYLDAKPDVIKATGGTNWQQYLPPRHQRIIFYPDLWAEEDMEKWGRRIKFEPAGK